MTTAGESQTPRADLTASAASEPPRRLNPGERFRASFTILNEGRATAGASVVRLYLSSDQQPRQRHHAHAASRRSAGCVIGRQSTLSRHLPCPPASRAGSTSCSCAWTTRAVYASPTRQLPGVVAEVRHLHERARAGRRQRGERSERRERHGRRIDPAGLDLRRIARTQLDLGRSTVDLNQFQHARSGRNGGGQLHVLQRGQHADEHADPGRPRPPPGAVPQDHQRRPRLRSRRRRRSTAERGQPEQPARLPQRRVRRGPAGRGRVLRRGRRRGEDPRLRRQRHAELPRPDRPAHERARGQRTPGSDDVDGGEGKHQALAVMRDPDPGRTRATTAAATTTRRRPTATTASGGTASAA